MPNVCAVCTELKEQFVSQAEQEARATLEQRVTCLGHTGSGQDTSYTRLQEVVDSSRRKQAAIADQLIRHVSAAHSESKESYWRASA